MDSGTNIQRRTNKIVFVLILAFLITVLCLIYILFQHSPSNLTIEILASIIAALLVLTSVIVSIHLQQESEMHREFNVELFKKKLELYEDFINKVAIADDDGTISNKEMDELLNSARKVALLGSSELVQSVVNFLEHVVTKRNVISPEYESSFRRIVFNMREDLDVVEPSKDITKSIQSLMKLAESANTNDSVV